MTVGIGEWARAPRGRRRRRPTRRPGRHPAAGPGRADRHGGAAARGACPAGAGFIRRGADRAGDHLRAGRRAPCCARRGADRRGAAGPGAGRTARVAVAAGRRRARHLDLAGASIPCSACASSTTASTSGRRAGRRCAPRADGVVESCGRQATPGIFVRLRHGDRVETLYAHLDRFADRLRIGQAVAAGTVVAYLGSTGMSTGPHLYYELRIDGQAVDPLGSAARLPDAPAARAVAAVR
ncbi:MAG: M23 family metallopeptidase [Dongiaceae bacterium]